jgi:hypothetical protein
MSVRVSPDDGPSYTLHEPTPARGLAVCARCVHVNRGVWTAPKYCEAWTCAAVPLKTVRPAGTDPITGEHVRALTSGTRCTERNKSGECPDFLATSAVTSTKLTAWKLEPEHLIVAAVLVLALGGMLGAAFTMAIVGGRLVLGRALRTRGNCLKTWPPTSPTLYRRRRCLYVDSSHYVQLTLDCPGLGRECVEVHVGESEAAARQALTRHCARAGRGPYHDGRCTT